LIYLLANEYDELNSLDSDRSLIERIEMKAIHNIALPSTNLELSANVQHDLMSGSYIWRGNVYKNETRFQLGVRFNF
jgi:hypothetical protein